MMENSRRTRARADERPVILASSSPRRRWLLERAGLPVRIITPPPEAEEVGAKAAPTQRVLLAARAKAFAVASKQSGALVLGADTVVVLDGEVLGKPESEADARRMLGRLSGRCHEVHTAVVVAAVAKGHPTVLAEAVVSSAVAFRALTAQEIEEYVRTGEPMDKAGGYGIQGGGCEFVASIEGPWDNVVGLPVDTVLALLASAKEKLAAKEADGDTALVQ